MNRYLSMKSIPFLISILFGATVVTGTAETFEKAERVLIQFNGLGGNIQRYGVTAQSTLNFAGSVVKLGYFPMVFENPLYFGARKLSDAERASQVASFTDLDKQCDWYTSVFERVIEADPKKRFGVYGRSSGGSLLFHWFRQGLAGDVRIQKVLEKVDFVSLGGIVGWQSDIMQKWTSAEDLEGQKDSGALDMPSTHADRKLQLQMRQRAKAIPMTRVVTRLSLQ
jgi:hypothetical protein